LDVAAAKLERRQRGPHDEINAAITPPTQPRNAERHRTNPMRIATILLSVAALAAFGGYTYGRRAAATSPLAVPVADGPATARFRTGTVPRAEVEAEIAKQPEVMRAALRTPAARKTFTDGIVRFELFSHEAEPGACASAA
jgi:hypothetical protein